MKKNVQWYFLLTIEKKKKDNQQYERFNLLGETHSSSRTHEKINLNIQQYSTNNCTQGNTNHALKYDSPSFTSSVMKNGRSSAVSKAVNLFYLRSDAVLKYRQAPKSRLRLHGNFLKET